MTSLCIALALPGVLLALGAACHALLHKRDPQAALAWVAFIMLLPYAGAVAYLLAGVSRVDSHAAHLLASAAKAQEQADAALDRRLPQPVPPVPPGEAVPPEQTVARVGRALTGREPLAGNSIRLLRNGEEAYPAMLAAIHEASSYVYLSTYIFKGGLTGNAFADALAQAARRGVDVRLLVDGLGASLYSRAKPWQRLGEAGVQVRRFLPPRLFPPAFSINLRTHRKVLVCDGLVGFTGGMNIGDHHLVERPGKNQAQDIHFRCAGPIALLLQEAFLMDWAFVTRKQTAPSLKMGEPHGSSWCRLVFDGLGRGRDDIHDLLCGVISGARERVAIMTPYFLPPRELSNALTSAALRGVDVRIMLPEVNNLPYVHRASRHMQPDLIRKGVRIFFQPPPFAHTKLLLVDDYYTLVGSANLDPRSLFLNFELNMEVFDTTFCASMSEYFLDLLSRSTEFTVKDYDRRHAPCRLLDAALWIFSPYL
ncbi:MAG: PLDc N-terminal domain-containing protein [Desulfovibrionaceae bacterium]|nr:PLDc N-terminal domain-containing protein [Desulfovibrionaceae bacterium]